MAVTENITVLFTDLVGSTELVTSLTPEAGDEVRRAHFSILRQAVAEMGGTEVKNLGDGIMVVFPSTSSALSCAVAMQQRVDRGNRDLERPLGLRVGLSGGEATKETDDYFGEPVIEAARICAKAEGGQILASDLVRAMAGRRTGLKFASVGALTLKGLPEPVQTVEVLWEPIGGTPAGNSIPLPGRLSVQPEPGVVGREGELALITDAVKRVSAGGGREVLLVSGEAGLGKTTLVAEASRTAHEDGAVVLFGHCEEDLATPYQLFAEALGHFVTHAPEERLVAHVGIHGSELAKLVPALSSRIPALPPSKASDSDTERFLLFAAVIGLLTQVSESQPVVVVLDDLQWADHASLLLLRHLAAGDRSMRVLVVGTYRDSELSHANALVETLSALHRQTGASRIELTGLDDSGVVALMEAAAGYAMDDAGIELAHALYRETDGNPFFVGEVLRHLAETGTIQQDASGRWVAAGGLDQMALPDSVRMVIGARVLRLGPDAGRVLSTAAVIGREFDLDVLALATTTPEDAILDILDDAAAAALVRELPDTPGRYSFAHALIRHTLYEDLGRTRGARAHRRVAEALEELCGDRPGARVGELARHWVNASQPMDLARAMGYSCQAGDAALNALAPADALGYYAQALDLYPQASDPDPILAIDLAIGLGIAQRQTGDPDFRVTLLDAARRAADLGDTPRLVAAALANSRGFFSNLGATDTQKVDILEMALDRVPDDSPDRALVLATLCAELGIGSALERRVALADEAIVISEATGDDALTARVLNRVAISLNVPSLHEKSLARTADALDRAGRVGDPTLLFDATESRMLSAAQAGDIEEVDRCVLTLGSLSERLGQPRGIWSHTFRLALRAQIAGDVDRAEELATEALRIGTEGGEPDATTFWGGQLIAINHQRGTIADLIPLIEQLAAETPTTAGVFTATLARAYAEADRIEEARRQLEEFSVAGFELPMDQSWATGMVCYASAAIGVGEARFAGPLFDQLAPWSEQSVVTGITASGPVSGYLGGLAAVLDRGDEAETYFAHCARVSDRNGAKYFGARTHLWWGQMLARGTLSGDTETARGHLVRAHSAAVEHGYGSVERRAAEGLAQLPD